MPFSSQYHSSAGSMAGLSADSSRGSGKRPSSKLKRSAEFSDDHDLSDSSTFPTRKSDTDWEEMKDIILKQYQQHTLEEVMDYMQESHNFTATKRQYIHRIGEKWGVKKYSSGKSIDSEVPIPGDGDHEGSSGNRPSAVVAEERSNGGRGKRPKVLIPEAGDDMKLSCPFRRRNPIRFNVRDYQSCAVTSFPDISQLKRHVKNFHKLRRVSIFTCPRCKQDLGSKDRLDGHLIVPIDRICEPREARQSRDPEDGITSRIEDILNGRKANNKVDTWDVLWLTLFPDDRDVPPQEFQPPREHLELQDYIMENIPTLTHLIMSEVPNILPDMKEPLEKALNEVLAGCIERFSQERQTNLETHRKKRRVIPPDPIPSRPETPSGGPNPETKTLKDVKETAQQTPENALELEQVTQQSVSGLRGSNPRDFAVGGVRTGYLNPPNGPGGLAFFSGTDDPPWLPLPPVRLPAVSWASTLPSLSNSSQYLGVSETLPVFRYPIDPGAVPPSTVQSGSQTKPLSAALELGSQIVGPQQGLPSQEKMEMDGTG